MLVVPQGFTLSVTGVFAITLGHLGYPGPAGIWLFVAGAAAGFCGVTLASGAHREVSNRAVSITGPALLNLLPILVIPTACGATWWVSSDSVAFLAAGICAAALYVI